MNHRITLPIQLVTEVNNTAVKTVRQNTKISNAELLTVLENWETCSHNTTL